MTVDIFIPLMRFERFPLLVANIRLTTPEPYEIHVMVSGAPSEAIWGRQWPDCHLWLDGGGTYIERMNTLFCLSKAPHFFLGADDVVFYDGWLAPALAAMEEVDGVVAVNDLHNPAGTCGLVSRRYIEEMGTIDQPGLVLHPGYRHNWCDSELFATAKHRGRFAYCAESVVEHLHPCAGKAEDDEVYRLGISSEPQDRALFVSRSHLWA